MCFIGHILPFPGINKWFYFTMPEYLQTLIKPPEITTGFPCDSSGWSKWETTVKCFHMSLVSRISFVHSPIASGWSWTGHPPFPTFLLRKTRGKQLPFSKHPALSSSSSDNLYFLFYPCFLCYPLFLVRTRNISLKLNFFL